MESFSKNTRERVMSPQMLAKALVLITLFLASSAKEINAQNTQPPTPNNPELVVPKKTNVDKIENAMPGINVPNPTWDFDMKKYPGLSPSDAFMENSLSKMTLEQRIKALEQYIKEEKQNLELDKKMNEPQETIDETLKKIRELEERLRKELQNLNHLPT